MTPVGDEPEDFEAPVGGTKTLEHLEDFDESYRKDRRDAWEQHLIDFYECYEQETSFVNAKRVLRNAVVGVGEFKVIKVNCGVPHAFEETATTRKVFTI